MEILGIESWLFWFLLAIGLLVGEIAIAFTLYLGGVAPAALAASGVAALGGSISVQLIAFIIGAVISSILLRPIAKRHLLAPAPELRSNVQNLIGRRAVALSVIDIDSGTVRIGDDVWSARTESESVVIPEGARTEVTSVSGVYVYVKPSETFGATN